jgi:hypothetical protein
MMRILNAGKKKIVQEVFVPFFSSLYRSVEAIAIQAKKTLQLVLNFFSKLVRIWNVKFE